MTIDQAVRRKTIARWHRRLAIFIAIWLVVLAVSGLLINHAHDLGLDRSPLPGPLQQLVYGIEKRDDDLCAAISNETMDCTGVFARLQLPGGLLLLSPDSLLLLDQSGQLLEKLITGNLGLGTLQAGFREGSRIYLRDARKTVMTDTDLMDAVVLDQQAVDDLDQADWQTQGPAMESIHWERLFLDLHAARFLGPYAKWFNDLMALLILSLAISGVRLYRLKRKANGNA